MGSRLLCLLIAVGAAAAGCGGGGMPSVAKDGVTRPGWTTLSPPGTGLTFSFPSDWQIARRSLTPKLAEPGEVFAVGTGELRSDGRCANVPTHALEELEPKDALVVLFGAERRGVEFEERPARFRFSDGYAMADAKPCARGRDSFQTWFIPFRDADRDFYALIAIGSKASFTTRMEALGVLDSLDLGADQPIAGAGR